MKSGAARNDLNLSLADLYARLEELKRAIRALERLRDIREARDRRSARPPKRRPGDRRYFQRSSKNPDCATAWSAIPISA